MAQSLTIQRFDFFALQDFIAPALIMEDMPEATVVEVVPPPPPALTFSEDELERAKRAAFDQGIAEGIQRGKEDVERLRVDADLQLTQQLRIVAERLAQAESIFAQAVETERNTMQALAFGVARKLAGQALEANAPKVLEAMIAHCLPHVLSQPALLIRVHPEAKPAVEAMVVRLADSHGFDGTMTVRGDDTLSQGDIRIDWQFGAVERRIQPLLDEMGALFLSGDEAEEEAEHVLPIRPHPTIA